MVSSRKIRQYALVLKRRWPSESWQRVGSITVDSGRCLIVDPSYHRDGFYGVVEADAAIMSSVTADSQTARLLATDGMAIGTVVATGYGDDEYPVEVRYVVDERGVRRIAELRVRFMDDE
jgi:hypothetical protein